MEEGIIKTIKELREYFTGMPLNLKQLLHAYQRGNLEENIISNNEQKKTRKLTKRKYI